MHYLENQRLILVFFLAFLYQIPVALLISQLQKDIGSIPSLLRFSEVVSLFHEFGHVVCLILNYLLGFIIYDLCIKLANNKCFWGKVSRLYIIVLWYHW